MSWKIIVGTVVATAIAAGAYYFFAQGGYPATSQEMSGQAARQNDSANSIESDLNATGDVDASADLDSLQQSL